MVQRKEKLHLPQPLVREGQEEEGRQRGCWILGRSAEVILVQTPQIGGSIQKLLFGLGGVLYMGCLAGTQLWRSLGHEPLS